MDSVTAHRSLSSKCDRPLVVSPLGLIMAKATTTIASLTPSKTRSHSGINN
ncbi:hypothetical protein [Geminocystis sp. GBBB08]|uniref:hypothetical protein n=1 Tax=Geminocystis sp. GBBB08 TaxID=2604140 RepID=UPI0027E26A4F|nr:hypothetical protein [Geminocystis sp. GBBB08]